MKHKIIALAPVILTLTGCASSKTDQFHTRKAVS